MVAVCRTIHTYMHTYAHSWTDISILDLCLFSFLLFSTLSLQLQFELLSSVGRAGSKFNLKIDSWVKPFYLYIREIIMIFTLLLCMHVSESNDVFLLCFKTTGWEMDYIWIIALIFLKYFDLNNYVAPICKRFLQ